MQEIITWIEEVWVKWSDSRSVDCQWINVDETNFKEIAKHCLHSDKIIITCFNLKMASVLAGLRGKLSINTPWIFYLHGLASFGCWPLYRWNVGELLNSNDVFVGSCQRDVSQVRIVFPTIKTFIIPFSLPLPSHIKSKPKPKIKKLAFIGRISSQKNLHGLIIAASLLQQDFELHFFGKEDFYGSPLMGFRDQEYLDFLKNLASEQGISERVIFHGFMDRVAIENIMNDEEWIFVAPSIHSDENFGMAAFRCLLNGHRVILSDWGGHADYPAYFPDQVRLVKVYHSPIGPWISINELSSALSQDFNSSVNIVSPSYYSEDKVHEAFDQLMNISEDRALSIPTNPILETLLSNRERYLQENHSSDGSRLYENYADPVKNPFFFAYAGGEWRKNETQNNRIVSWVKVTDTAFQVSDPHRGKFTLSKKEDLAQMGLTYSSM